MGRRVLLQEFVNRDLAAGEPFAFVPDFAAFLAGLKPVIKVESHGESSPEALVDALRARCDDVVVVPAEGWAGDRIWFVSRSEEAAREASRLTAGLRGSDPETDPDSHVEAVARIGELLGYPPCCARAFAEDERRYDGRYEWLRLLRRVEHPEPVPAEMGPHSLSFVPCRLDCPEALDFARRTREVLVRERVALGERRPDMNAALEALSSLSSDRLPSLRFLDDETRFAVVAPRAPMGAGAPDASGAQVLRFPYELVGGALAPEHEDALARGEELAIGPGTASVLRSGREIYVFGREVWFWSHEQAFHVDFWREVLLAPALTPVDDGPEASGEPETPAAPAPPDPFAQTRAVLEAAMRGVIRRLNERSHPAFVGFELDAIEATPGRSGWGLLRVVTRHEGQPFVLCFVPREDSTPRFRETARFAVFHESDTPASSEARRRLMALLVRSLERVAPDSPETT